MLWIDYLIIVFSIVMVVLVMLQSSNDDMASAFSGEKSELFKNKKERGFELFLTRASIVTAVLLIAAVVLSNNLH
ncbi:MAG: preprotein translocase subunit SecG [Acholeplasmataceae bacterium]